MCCDLVSDICCDDTTLEMELCLTVEYISALTNTNWCPKQDCKIFDGTGDCKLFFNKRTSEPLQAYDTITIVDCNGCMEYMEDVVNCKHWLETKCLEDEFPCGSNNIYVCGWWGHDMPSNIRKAIFMLTLERVQPGITGYAASSTASQVSWDDFSISYEKYELSGSPYSTGYLEIDRLIAPFIPSESEIGFFVIDNKCPQCKICKEQCTCQKFKRY
jgi:hypothetical protein